MKAEDLFLVVRVEGVDKKTPQDEVESHFGREFEGVLKVERARDAMSMGARRAPDKRHAAYDITFKEEKFCKAFLDTAELKMGDQVLRSQLLSALIQSKILRRQLNLAFAHNFRLMACAPMEEGKEDSYLLVYGIGRPTDEELQEYFLGLESQFEGIVSAKTVVTGRGEEEGQGKMLGVLVKFESKVALEKFTQLKELKYKEQVVRFNLMGEVVKRNDVRLRKANYVVDDGPTTQQLSSRRVIVLRWVRPNSGLPAESVQQKIVCIPTISKIWYFSKWGKSASKLCKNTLKRGKNGYICPKSGKIIHFRHFLGKKGVNPKSVLAALPLMNNPINHL